MLLPTVPFLFVRTDSGGARVLLSSFDDKGHEQALLPATNDRSEHIASWTPSRREASGQGDRVYVYYPTLRNRNFVQQYPRLGPP